MPVTTRADAPNSWLITFRTPDGRRVRKVVSRNKAPTKRAAEALERELIADAATGRLDLRRGKATWTEVADRYWQEHGQHLGWAANVQGHLRAIGAALPAPGIGQLNGTALAAMVAAWRREGKAAGTINNRLAVFRQALNHARDIHGVAVPALPWRKMAQAKPDAPRRYMGDGELDLLVEAAAPHLRHAIMLSLLTGLRRGAVLALDWQQVDLSRGIIHARGKGRAGGKANAVPITSDVQALLLEIGPQPSGPVISYKGKRLKSLDTAFNKARARAGLPHLQFHDLRRTFAQDLLDVGGQEGVVSKALHHSSVAVTRRYAEMQIGMVRDTIEQAQQRRRQRRGKDDRDALPDRG